jgi:putative phage-type endonuclease
VNSAALTQGSDAWHEWRLGGIGASEVPVLMLEDDRRTPRDIWRVKTRRIKEPREANFAMQRGIDAEPKIRALYELYNDVEMPPKNLVHPEIPYLRASADGFNEAISKGAEFKYPGAEKHALAVAGEIPRCYFGQVQAQLFVSGAGSWDYVSYDGVDIAVVNQKPDFEYIARMLKVVDQFWMCVVENREPPITTGDYLDLNDETHVQTCERYRHAKKNNHSDREIKRLRDLIVATVPADHNRILCSGVEIVRAGSKTIVRIRE